MFTSYVEHNRSDGQTADLHTGHDRYSRKVYFYGQNNIVGTGCLKLELISRV